jgi:long-chain fatty acid transport protein
MRALAAVILVLCVASAPGSAFASPLFELTGDLTEQGGLSARAASTGAGAASTYFNPALLPHAPPGASLGVFVLNDQIGIALDGRNGGDVPRSFRGATHANGAVFAEPSLPTPWLREGCSKPECPLALASRPRQSDNSSHETKAYQAIGLVLPIVRDTVALGFYGLVPLAQFTTAHSFFPDEREQFFTNSLHPELYSDRLTATSLAFGLGARVLPELSLGLGATLSLHNTATAQTFVGNADDLERTLVLSTDVGVEVAFAPHFGVVFTPFDRLQLSAAVHTVQRFDIESGVSTFLPDGNKQVVFRTSVHDYMPARVGFGAQVDLVKDPEARHELSLIGSGLLGFWSSYVDRQGARAPEWRNTVSLGVGVRHSYGSLRSFVDGAFSPAAVPLQTGRTNYVDNTRWSAGAGVDYDFELFAVHLRVGARAQLHLLVERHQTKLPGAVRDEFPDDAVDSRSMPIAAAAGLQTNNPGWPGFSSSGVLFGGGVSLSLLL